MTCPHCQDTGWVCEAHPDKAFDSGLGGFAATDNACDCGAAGMTCDCECTALAAATEYQRLNFGPELT